MLPDVVSYKTAWRSSQTHTVRLLGRTALGTALACLLELARPPESFSTSSLVLRCVQGFLLFPQSCYDERHWLNRQAVPTYAIRQSLTRVKFLKIFKPLCRRIPKYSHFLATTVPLCAGMVPLSRVEPAGASNAVEDCMHITGGDSV